MDLNFIYIKAAMLTVEITRGRRNERVAPSKDLKWCLYVRHVQFGVRPQVAVTR